MSKYQKKNSIVEDSYNRLFSSWNENDYDDKKPSTSSDNVEEEYGDFEDYNLEYDGYIVNEKTQNELLIKFKNRYLEKRTSLKVADIKNLTGYPYSIILESFAVDSIKELNQLIRDEFPEVCDADLTYYYIKIIKNNYEGNINNLKTKLGEELFYKIEKYFISWNNAIEMAGFQSKRKKYNEYTNKEKSKIIQNVILYSLRLNRSIKAEDIVNVDGVEDYRALEFIFNMRWNSFKRQLDLPMNQTNKFKLHSNEKLLDNLRKNMNEEGIIDLFLYSVNKSDDDFAAIYYFSRFNILDWNELNEILRSSCSTTLNLQPSEYIESNHLPNNFSYIKLDNDLTYDIIENIIKYTLRNGNTLNNKTIENITSPKTIFNIFVMSLDELKFRLDTRMVRQREFKTISNELLINQLKKDIEKYNIKSLEDYSLQKTNDMFAAIYYYKRFKIDCWNKFIDKIMSE